MPQIDRRSMIAGGLAGIAATTIPHAANAGSGENDLTGISILITGASSGFGRLGAEHYARQGAKVFASMRNLPRPEADALRQLARDQKLDITVLEIDVRNDAQVAAGVKEAERLAGKPLDVLVNNAGIMITGPVEMQDMEAMNLLFDTNLFGFQRMARAVLPGMRRAKAGYIVSIASQGGRVIFPGLGAYSASKFAVESWAEQLAYETAMQGVTVSIVEPGGYPTRIMENSNTQSSSLKAREPAERVAAYPALAAQMGQSSSSSGAADPMDIPRAICEMIASKPVDRPLRKMVSHTPSPQEPINTVAAEVQYKVLSNGPFAAAGKAVLKR